MRQSNALLLSKFMTLAVDVPTLMTASVELHFLCWSYVFLLIVWQPQWSGICLLVTAEIASEEEPRAAARGWLQNATRKVPLGRYLRLSLSCIPPCFMPSC